MSERDQYGCLPDPAPLPTALERRTAVRMPTLNQQIDWYQGHLCLIKSTTATAVRRGEITQEKSDQINALASALLATAINVRAIVRGQEINHD